MQRRCVSVCMQMHESCIQAGIAGENSGSVSSESELLVRVSGSQGLSLRVSYSLSCVDSHQSARARQNHGLGDVPPSSTVLLVHSIPPAPQNRRLVFFIRLVSPWLW